MINEVYTYHDPTVGRTDPELLKLWRASWAKHGWTPVVLGPVYAQQHPRYDEFNQVIHTYHTVNFRNYEDACYLRWLALWYVGGGLMTDADVLNYDFTPYDLAKAYAEAGHAGRMLGFETHAVPCAVYGDAAAYKLVVDFILAYGKLVNLPRDMHTSDMFVFQAMGPDRVPLCSEFNREWNGVAGRPWDKFPLTHFSNESVKHQGYLDRNKHLVIQKYRPPIRHLAPALPPVPEARVKLPDVTLLCITDDADKALWAFERCLLRFEFADARILSHSGIHKIRLLGSRWAYSEFILRHLKDYFTTSHCLLIQHDGYVVNQDAWDPEFLAYDYIGAPWLSDIVGNGGFSLRSHKLAEATVDLELECDSEDWSICMHHRAALEAQGIKFAPLEVASRFSVEDRPWAGQLGFHGLNTGITP